MRKSPACKATSRLVEITAAESKALKRNNDAWKPGEFGDMWAKALMWGTLGDIVFVVLYFIFSK